MTRPPWHNDTPSTRPVRILLVDDAAQVRLELRGLLELSGRVEIVGEGGNGQEAIQLASELAPDVVLMDLEMPILGGLEATRRIKALWPAMRVVILSVHSRPREVELGREAGADEYVEKGCEYQTLLNAILEKDGKNNSITRGDGS